MITVAMASLGCRLQLMEESLACAEPFLEMRAHVFPHLVMPVGPFVSALRSPVV